MNDTLGLGVAYARFSRAARGADRHAARSGQGSGLVRSSEAVIELSYQAEIVPGLTVQPDFQYVIRPGGRVADPRDTQGGAIKDAAVFGPRATVRYEAPRVAAGHGAPEGGTSDDGAVAPASRSCS